MMSEELVNLTIDGKQISVPKGTTVYHAATQLGVDLPIFCYQDRMPPFGACRVCLVEVENMHKLQASCTLEVKEGMVVKTQSQRAVEGREGILELLLINHPLDCPICDKGGECPLQDQALKFGPPTSRFYEDKRKFVKQLPLGPVLMLDRERCIVCARCTRFGDIVAGDHALEFIERGYKTEVGTPDGAPVKSKFIGNTIMICPVGALTSQVYRFRARPWDNHPTHSTCALCPVGCSMTLDERDGEIMRTRSCENKGLNDIWLCDKGWFGYEFIDHPNRLQTPMVRRNGSLEPATWEETFDHVILKLQQVKGKGKVAGWGGNPLTVEENYLFQHLIRVVGGSNHVDHRVGMPIRSLEEEGIPAGMSLQVGECEQLSHAFLFGLDLTEEFPVIWLRLKLGINQGMQVSFFGNFAPEIAQHLHAVHLHAPGAETDTIEKFRSLLEEAIRSGKKVAFFIGSQYLNVPHRKEILSKLQQIASQSPNVSLQIMEGRGNSVGARWAGMHPEFAPGGKRIEKAGMNILQVMEEGEKRGWDYLHVAGANPALKYPNHWSAFRKNLHFLVVQDLFLTETARQADVVFPVLSFVEKSGTFTNIERRNQKLLPGKPTPEIWHSDGFVFAHLAERLGIQHHLDQDFRNTIDAEFLPAVKQDKISSSKVDHKNQMGGLKGVLSTALFDTGTRMKHNSHLIQLAKEPFVRLNPHDAHRSGLQSGEKAKFTSDGTSILAKIKIDKTVAEGSAVFPLGFDQLAPQKLSPNFMNYFEVKVEKENK